MKLLTFKDDAGYKVSIRISEIEAIEMDVPANKTIIYTKSGTKFFMDASFDKIKSLLENEE